MVAIIKAETTMIDSYENDIKHHSYVLKENNIGQRMVIINSAREVSAKSHGRYIKTVKPWEEGMDFSFIPSYHEIKNKVGII